MIGLTRPLLVSLSLALATVGAGCLAPPPPPPVSTAPMTLTEVQSGLAELGYYRAGVDGLMGPATRRAIRGFEQDQGLPVTGQPSPALEVALRAALDGEVVARGGPTGAPVVQARQIVERRFSPARYTTTDLNGDGLADVIAAADIGSGFCGMQECAHMVLINTGDGFRVVADAVSASHLVPGPRSTRGYRDLQGGAMAGVG